MTTSTGGTVNQQRDITPAEAYQEYYGPAIFEPLARVLFEYATPRPGDRVLDVACGTGIVTRHAASLVGADGRVVGVDINPGMIDVAQALPSPAEAAIEWRRGDAVRLELPDASFDLVLCQQGLQFFPDRPAGVREMRRTLADGGCAVVAVWQGPDRHPLFDALADAEVPHLTELGAPVTRDDAIAPFSLGDAGELAALFTDAGFHDVEIVTRSIEARFTDPDRFVERLEYAYAAVVPQFAENPATFASYLEVINRETREIVERYHRGDQIVVPMHTHILVAQA